MSTNTMTIQYFETLAMAAGATKWIFPLSSPPDRGFGEQQEP
jgi:hypothetical protein